MVDSKLPQTIETGITQTKEIDNIQITDHETIQTTDQTKKTITIDHVTFLGTEIITTQIDKKFVLTHSSHINNTQNENSQQNYRSSTPKHQKQINRIQTTEVIQSDPPGINNSENLKLQLNHIKFESTDDESEKENTLSKNILHIENEYETSMGFIAKYWKFK